LALDAGIQPDLAGAALDLVCRDLQGRVHRRHRLAQFDDMAIALLPVVEKGEGVGDVFKGGLCHDGLLSLAAVLAQPAARVKIPGFIRRLRCPITKGATRRPRGDHAMLRILTTLILCTAVLGGCNRFSGWFSPASRAPASLEPKDGYPTAADERRALLRAIASARFEQISEGRLLVVVANAPTKGWWDVELVTETPQPEGRYQPDEDGVLRLRLV